jgi:hypothetical protein
LRAEWSKNQTRAEFQNKRRQSLGSGLMSDRMSGQRGHCRTGGPDSKTGGRVEVQDVKLSNSGAGGSLIKRADRMAARSYRILRRRADSMTEQTSFMKERVCTRWKGWISALRRRGAVGFAHCSSIAEMRSTHPTHHGPVIKCSPSALKSASLSRNSAARSWNHLPPLLNSAPRKQTRPPPLESSLAALVFTPRS